MYDWDRIFSEKKIYIVGAGSRAKTLTGYLRELYPQVEIVAYLVSLTAENEPDIDGVPVLQLDAVKSTSVIGPVFIATKGMYHEQLNKQLLDLGFTTVVPITPAVDNDFRNLYVRKKYQRQGWSFQKLDELSAHPDDPYDSAHVHDLPDVCIYMAKSIYDKPLSQSYEVPGYERPIQVGAALTEQRLCQGILTDCTGENISEKNRQYCELTALYWIWKQAEEKIVGLSHYRRHFLLPEDWCERMTANHIDVILPVPTCVLPNIEKNYMERHAPEDWIFLQEYLRENSPEDYEMGRQVYTDTLYSPCNMFIMRKDILDELCGWIFPILDAVVAHGGKKEDGYLNRYPGFLSERLLTLFFAKNKSKYKLAYADKNFLM